jgi:Zn-dependent membrane protease YugP
LPIALNTSGLFGFFEATDQTVGNLKVAASELSHALDKSREGCAQAHSFRHRLIVSYSIGVNLFLETITGQLQTVKTVLFFLISPHLFK